MGQTIIRKLRPFSRTELREGLKGLIWNRLLSVPLLFYHVQAWGDPYEENHDEAERGTGD